jgi:hypothetical protein
LPVAPQNVPDIVDLSHGSNNESSGPLISSSSTAVATNPNATPNVKTEEVSSRSNTSSRSPPPIVDFDQFSDSDLTEIDDDVPGVAFNSSTTPDATVGNQTNNGNDNIIDVDNPTADAGNSTRRSTRRRYPTHRLTLWAKGVNSDEPDQTRRRHSLPAPEKSSNFLTISPRPATLLPASKQRNTKSGPKAKHAAVSDAAERRISNRLQNAMTNETSLEEYSDEEPYHSDRGMVIGSSRSAGGSQVAVQTVVPKVETEDSDIIEPDSWKAGWAKSDSWAKELHKIEPFVEDDNDNDNESGSENENENEDDPVPTKRKIIPSRNILRSQRIGQSVHKKSYSKLTMSRRVECPKGCGKTFGRAHDAHRHADQTMGCGGGEKPFVCTKCGNHFSRKDALKRHQGYTIDGKRSAPRRCSAMRR